ncbi:MAG: 50S ribosomal protein L5 [Acidobacteriota bacterium]|jgi:large subunit ribosomal protein L5|nr:50S ribosomal protein L5 [Acidobacteriota bacterium]
MSRLYEQYREKVRDSLKKELDLKNIMMVPRLEKIVVNSGVGEATQNIKALDKVMEELGIITGQKPTLRRARKSIAQFRLRAGMPVGATVTLRGLRMYDFLDRLISIVLPRIKDFRGISPRSFDGRGNYTLALKDQLVFPEIDYNKVENQKGMAVTIVTSARTDKEALALLKELGMPFR